MVHTYSDRNWFVRIREGQIDRICCGASPADIAVEAADGGRRLNLSDPFAFETTRLFSLPAADFDPTLTAR